MNFELTSEMLSLGRIRPKLALMWKNASDLTFLIRHIWSWSSFTNCYAPFCLRLYFFGLQLLLVIWPQVALSFSIFFLSVSVNWILVFPLSKPIDTLNSFSQMCICVTSRHVLLLQVLHESRDWDCFVPPAPQQAQKQQKFQPADEDVLMSATYR